MAEKRSRMMPRVRLVSRWISAGGRTNAFFLLIFFQSLRRASSSRLKWSSVTSSPTVRTITPPSSLGRMLLHHLAQAGALLARLDLPAHAHLRRRRRHVDEEPAGDGDLRGDAGPLGADGLLGHLDQQRLAALQQVLDRGELAAAAHPHLAPGAPPFAASPPASSGPRPRRRLRSPRRPGRPLPARPGRRRGGRRSSRRRCRRRRPGSPAGPLRPCRGRCRPPSGGPRDDRPAAQQGWSSSTIATRVSRGLPLIRISRFNVRVSDGTPRSRPAASRRRRAGCPSSE